MSKTIKNSATCVDTICLSVQNDATHQADFYLGQSAVLDIKLVNATGADIALQGAKLDIFFLSLNVGLSACRIDLPGWTFSSGAYSLTLTYTGGASQWGQGDFNALQFQISGVQSSLTQATAGFFQINFSGLTGQNVPGRLKTPLNLMAAPKPGNASLDLSLDLADGGIIYVSQPNGSLVTNRLLLNVINQGAQPLFSGTPGQQGQPQIAVSFVYGTTPGALAPDADKSAPQSGSAWNISGKVSAGQGNDWAVTNPSASGAATDPVWLLTPAPTNSRLIGTGQHAVVQFEFDQIISQTQPGVTLMYVQLSGFKKDDNTLYNDQLFVLAIEKQTLPSPGLIRFSSTVSKVTISRSSQPVQFPLQWSMTGVSKVKLSFYSDDIPGLNLPDVHIPYPSPQPALQFGQYALDFQGVAHSGSLLITCSAYDANDNFLNDLQQTVDIDFPPVVTSYTGEIQLDGSLLLQWTTEGATAVTIFSNVYAANGHTVISPAPSAPLLNNAYYALIANGPNENSDPCIFSKSTAFSLYGNPVEVPGWGEGLAVSPNGKYVFASIFNGSSISVVEATPPYRALASPIPVGPYPGDLATAPQGRHLFASGLMSGILSVIDLSNAPNFPVVATVQLGDQFAYGYIAVSNDERYVFATGGNSGEIGVVQTDSTPPFAILEPITGAGSDLRGLGCSPDGQYLFTANISTSESSFSVISIKNGPPFRVVQTLIPPSSFSPIDLKVGAGCKKVFIQDADGIYVVDINGNPPFQIETILQGPCDSLAISPDGRFLFMAHDGVIEVMQISSDPSFKTVQTLSDSNGKVLNMAFSKDGTLFITHDANATLTIVQPSSVSAF